MAKCQHLDFMIRGPEQIGFCTCKKCGEQIWFPDALNRLTARVQRALAQLKKARKER